MIKDAITRGESDVQPEVLKELDKEKKYLQMEHFILQIDWVVPYICFCKSKIRSVQ